MSSLAIVAFSIFPSPFRPSALPTFFLLTRWPHLSLLATLLGSVYEFCLESLPIRKIKLIVFLRGSRAILRLCVLSHFILILQPDVFSRLIRINRSRSQKSFVSVDVINSGQLAPRRMTKTTQKKPRYLKSKRYSELQTTFKCLLPREPSVCRNATYLRNFKAIFNITLICYYQDLFVSW